MTPLVIGVTSHRNIPADEIEPIRQRVQDFLAQLRRDFPALPLVVLSALAEGGDQLVAREALAAGARLVAPLPLPRELYVDDFADPAVRASFDALCAQAEIVQLPLPKGQSLLDFGTPGLARNFAHSPGLRMNARMPFPMRFTVVSCPANSRSAQLTSNSYRSMTPIRSPSARTEMKSRPGWCKRCSASGAE